jgi:FMN-dependent NADH-azoreductase
MAKTIGDPDLKNIYIRTKLEDNLLKLALTFKIYKDGIQETEKTIEMEDLESELIPYINNPFMSVLLFTTEADVTMKLNKKRVANITEQPPTFKNADAVLLEYLAQQK